MGAHHTTVVLDLLKQRTCKADGDCESDAVSLGVNRCVDPNNSAVEVEERSSRVAGIDGSVSLDEIVVGAGADASRHGAHNPHRDCLRETEGVSNGNDPIAHPELIRIAELYSR